MFGFGEKARLKRIRADYAEIRQRVLFRMNPFEQYAVASSISLLPPEFQNAFGNPSSIDRREWVRVSMHLDKLARSSYRQAEKLGGIVGESERAASEGAMLLSLEALAMSYDTAQAEAIYKDIRGFREYICEFVTSAEYNYEPIPNPG